MNTIAELQNQPSFLQKLAASNALYDQSVQIAYIQLITAILIAIVFPILGARNPEWQNALTIITLLYFLVQVFFLHHWEAHKRMQATIVQELFDTELYKLPWNEIVAGEELTPAQKEARFSKNRKIHHQELLNWYPPAIAEVPLSIGRILCQRSSVWWNSHLRRACGHVMGSITLIILAALLWHNHQTPATVLATKIVIFLPLFEILIITTQSYYKSAARMERLRTILDGLLKNFLLDAKFTVSSQISRSIQDEIFRNRSSARPTPRFIYLLLLTRYRQRMNLTAENYINQLMHS